MDVILICHKENRSRGPRLPDHRVHQVGRWHLHHAFLLGLALGPAGGLGRDALSGRGRLPAHRGHAEPAKKRLIAGIETATAAVRAGKRTARVSGAVYTT